MLDLNELYFSNKDFNDYVSKYCKKEGIDLLTAFTHQMVINYALYLRDRGPSEPALTNMWKDTEDKSC